MPLKWYCLSVRCAQEKHPANHLQSPCRCAVGFCAPINLIQQETVRTCEVRTLPQKFNGVGARRAVCSLQNACTSMLTDQSKLGWRSTRAGEESRARRIGRFQPGQNPVSQSGNPAQLRPQKLPGTGQRYPLL